MAIRQLRYEGDELLYKKSKPVKEINDRIKILLDDMLETMHLKSGVGLAAPQVGILKRVVVIQLSPETDILELINPEILEATGTQINNEGCLSVPGESGYVERPSYVKIKALNRDGQEVIFAAEGLLAIACCHEIDHLDGILYTQKIINEEELEVEKVR